MQRRWQPQDGVPPREPRRRKGTVRVPEAARAKAVEATPAAAAASTPRAGVERGSIGAAAPGLPQQPEEKVEGWGRRGKLTRTEILTTTAVTPPFFRGCSRETPPISRSQGPGSTLTQVSHIEGREGNRREGKKTKKQGSQPSSGLCVHVVGSNILRTTFAYSRSAF